MASSSSSSDDESNIAIVSKGSTSLSHASIISSCRKLVAETPPVSSIVTGGSGSQASLADKKGKKKKRKGGVVESCRLLASQPSAIASDEQETNYRGVSYFLNRQDELVGPDLSSEVVAASSILPVQRSVTANYPASTTSQSNGMNPLSAGGRDPSVDRVDKNERKMSVKAERRTLMDNSESERSRVTFANDHNMNHDEWDPMADSKNGDNDEDRHPLDHEEQQSLKVIRRKLSSEYDRLHREDKYMDLPASTHTLLHTEPVCSFPFFFSLGIAVLSALCLILVLVSELKPGESGNWLDVPTGITTSVRVAQYCGILVGLLMEEEIPQGLILMRAISKQSFHATYPDLSYNRFIASCLLRLVMGYLFLLNLFVTVVQADDVITIFFDILALEFVQHLDDMAWELGRKDILGRNLNVATTVEYKVLTRVAYKRLLSEKQDEENALIARRKKSDEQQQQKKESEEEWRFYCIRRRKKMGFRWILKAAYFFNLAGLILGTIIVGSRQAQLHYSCKSVTITFGDQVWENAYVTNRTNSSHVEERTLIYSYFNGVYEITDRDRLGYPIYEEMNKNTGEPYQETIGAKIVYCEELESWIFTHELLSKQKDAVDDESDCPQWLLRSPKTKAFDLLDVPHEDWSVWTGVITPGNKVSIVCNVCEHNSDCNYNGECLENGKCVCETEFFGLHCEFKKACPVLIEDEGYLYTLATPPESNMTIMSYNRPIYTSATFLLDQILLDVFDEDIKNSTTSDPATDNATNAQQSVTNTSNTCYPEVRKIKIESTTGEAISMIEFQAQSSGVNVALQGTASQSSDLNNGEVLDASRAIDGSYDTFSSTNDTDAYWELFLPQSFLIESVLIVNGYCGNNSNSDPLGCLCRLSNATISLIDEFDAVTAYRSISDTCNHDVVLEAFDEEYPCSYNDNLTATAEAYNSTENSNQTDNNNVFSLYLLVALVYSGSRWFGTVEFGFEESFTLDPLLYGDEYHAFWDELYEGRTAFLSEPTSGSTPIGADFFENRFLQNTTWNDYGPYGMLTPVHNISGRGFFHCLGTNSTPVNVSTDLFIGE